MRKDGGGVAREGRGEGRLDEGREGKRRGEES